MKIVPRKARRLNELALFAGAGGGVLASRLLGWRTVCAVEIDPYCREVLLRRQEEGYLEPFPIWDDVRSFDAKSWRRVVDVISGGFPCQPFSVAGKRAGADDERNLWPETVRIIREVEPRFAFLENVPGLLNPIQDKETGETQASYFGTILRDLAESGYDIRWRVLSAAELGAPHKRDRIWIVANTKRTRFDTQDEYQARQAPRYLTWPTKPKISRVDDGMAYGVVQRLVLGNGQVPAVARAAWELLTQ